MKKPIQLTGEAVLLLSIVIIVGGCQKTLVVQPSRVAGVTPSGTSKKPPSIWQGTSFYDGADEKARRPESMTELLARYADQQLLRITRVSWSGCDFQRVEGLDRLPNLRAISLVGNHIESLEGLNETPLLEVANLSQNRIERIEGLDGLQNLRELHLSHNRIRRIEGLEGLTKLEVLMLVGNDIEEISGVSHLKSLKRLEVAGNKLKNIVALRDLPNLQTVSIESRRNQLDEESLRFIEEWNAMRADKPSLQLRSGMPAAGSQSEAPAELEPEAAEPP